MIKTQIESIDELNYKQEVSNQEFQKKLEEFDKLLLDNDRIIKLANLYTDETLGNFKKTVDTQLADSTYKLKKMEDLVDEEFEKLKRLKVSKEDLYQFETSFWNRLETEHINVCNSPSFSAYIGIE